ncbi:hypothetical protein ABT160_23595 [Streptomyces sp. NPDC001941]|uniref:hypothetical protein n=1 Tax=Streptomyces sp. NPDC001941 TaxID=3154659 RepID=UPI0033229B0E
MDLKNNPVLVRALVVAVFASLAGWFPALAEVQHSEPIVGGVVALVVLLAGWDVRRKVTPTEAAEADAERAHAQGRARGKAECCDHPHADDSRPIDLRSRKDRARIGE